MADPKQSMQLIVYEPPKEFYIPPPPPPAGQEERPGGNFLTRFVTFVCALACILTVTVILLNVMDWCARFSLREQVLTIANRALLGQALFSVDDNALLSDEDFPFPAPSDSAGETTDPSPADTVSPAAPAGPYPIRTADLSAGGDIFATFNETTYEPDGAALLAAPLPFADFSAWEEIYGGTGEPYILILHTHGTESYAAEGQTTYRPEDSFRTADTAANVVAVGKAMADTFAAAGIPVLHCREMFDRESYSDAYTLSSAAVRDYLAEHPSIRIVLDVHRDSVIRADKTKIRPATEVDGESTAQFMIVAGTDFKGANHPDWQKNLNFALKIQKNMTDYSHTLCRAINLRGAGFHQQYLPGSLLLEIGSCGNTLDEAKRTAVYAAAAITETVTGKPCPIRPGDILV